MPRFIKRKQIELKINDAPKQGYGVEDNKANLTEKDQLELALDKLAVLLDGRSIVELDQIWVESKLIPTTASITPGIVGQEIDVTLPGLTGENNSYRSVNLDNIIPEYFGDKISYQYVVKKSNGNVINLKIDHGYIDPLSGTLTFVNGNPSGVSHSLPPTISCYRYIGKTAEDTGIGGGGTGSGGTTSSQWQDSVINFTVNLPINPIIGDRYIFDGVASTSTNIIVNDQIVTGSVDVDDIITWTEVDAGTNSTSGTNAILEAWSIYNPDRGTFTSIDDLDNKIYYYRPVERWAEYRDERTYPIEIDLDAQYTYVNSGTHGFSHVLSDTQILEEATMNTDFNLYINGVKIKDDLYDFVDIVLNSNATYNSTSGLAANELSFNGLFTVNKGDLVKIVDISSNDLWRVVTKIVGNIITYSGPDESTINDAELYTYSIVIGNYPKLNSMILLKEGLTYDVEGGVLCDHLTFNYVKPTE